MLHQEWCVHLRAHLTVLEYAKVVGKDCGFACKGIGIDIGWDRLSLDNTCPEIVLRPAILFRRIPAR